MGEAITAAKLNGVGAVVKNNSNRNYANPTVASYTFHVSKVCVILVEAR